MAKVKTNEDTIHNHVYYEKGSVIPDYVGPEQPFLELLEGKWSKWPDKAPKPGAAGESPEAAKLREENEQLKARLAALDPGNTASRKKAEAATAQ